MKKLIILGNGTGVDLCPFNDKDYEIWATAVSLFNDRATRIDKVFEIHRKDEYLHDTYEKIYKTLYPVYTRFADKKIKKNLIFPYDKIIEKYGEYQCSSFSLMLCFAVESGYNDITLHGIDYDLVSSTREATIERPNLEYFIGYFRAKGIKINTEYTTLCTSIYCYGRDDIIRPLFYFDKVEKKLYEWLLRLSKRKIETADIYGALKNINKFRGFF